MNLGKLKLRIKNKYIIIGATIIVLSLVAIRVLGGNYLFYKARKAAYNHDRIKALAHYDAFIEQYPQHKKVAEALFRSADLFEQSAHTYSAFSPGSFMTSSVGHTLGSITDLAQASLTQEERYLLSLELNPSRWLADIIDYKLAQIYWQSGDLRCEELFLKILYEHDGFCPMAAARLIELYLKQSKIEQAREIADYWQFKEPDNKIFYTYLGDIYLEEGQYDLARQAYEKSNYLVVYPVLTFPLYFEEDRSGRHIDYREAKDYKRQAMQIGMPSYRENDESFGGQVNIIGMPSYGNYGEFYGEPFTQVVMPSYAENRELYLEKMASADSFTEVKGVATLDGKPLTGIKLKVNYKDHQLYNHHSVFRITDEEGMFSGKLPTDSYESLNIILDSRHMSLVAGKYMQVVERKSDGEGKFGQAEHEVCFHFKEPIRLKKPAADFVYEGQPFLISWEPYPDAKEYQLDIWRVLIYNDGRESLSFIGEKIKTRACDYLLPEDFLETHLWKDYIFGVFGMDQRGVMPSQLIHRWKAYDGIAIKIEALDESGNVIASNEDLDFSEDEWKRNEFPMARGLRNTGEQMLVERRYDEAVAYFERGVKENPDDTDSLWVLAAIYFHGTYYPESCGFSGIEEFNVANLAHKDCQKALEVLQHIQKLEPGSKVDSALRIVKSDLKKSKVD